jgi:hypothetical protein
VLQEQPPGVRLATSYCLCDLKRSKSNRSASMVTLYKLENLQMGVFSEVRQKICQGPELSVLTSVTNNHPSCAAPQGCESRCPRAPVKGGPLFYSDRDRNARWPIPSSLSDIPRAPSQFVDLFQASHTALTHQPAIQPRNIGRRVGYGSNRVCPRGCAWRIAKSVESRCFAQPFLGQPQFPKLRGLRNDAGVPSGSETAQGLRA